MSEKKKPVVIWVDGCFDMMHYGHANALRQAKLLGDYLIVGVHSDDEIHRVKGPTVMNEEERYQAVREVKWVDLVVENAPYSTSLEMIEKYNVDWVVHGDDPCFDENGNDAYQAIKDAGKFKMVKRTQGVSTTDIVNRMLCLSEEIKNLEVNPFLKCRQHLPTAQKIRQFTSTREPTPEDKIVYIDGVFDLFHVGHIDFLREGRKLGTYLIVGVHDDATSEKYRGKPIMNVHERVLGVLSSQYVDDVVIGAPYCVTQEVIDMLNISVVVHGSVQDNVHMEVDPYEIPKQIGMYHSIESPRNYLSANLIIQRIHKNHKIFEERNEKKIKKDQKNV
jgi:ethanolamine-phosphate cytidylyltransferase